METRAERVARETEETLRYWAGRTDAPEAFAQSVRAFRLQAAQWRKDARVCQNRAPCPRPNAHYLFSNMELAETSRAHARGIYRGLATVLQSQ